MDEHQVLFHQELADKDAPYRAEVLVPITDIHGRDGRVRRDITVTRYTDELVHNRLSPREYSATYEAGMMLMLYLIYGVDVERVAQFLSDVIGEKAALRLNNLIHRMNG